MPDNIPETGDVVISQQRVTRDAVVARIRAVPGRPVRLRNPWGGGKWWRDPVRGDVASICGFQRARASRYWHASAEPRVGHAGERALSMARLA